MEYCRPLLELRRSDEPAFGGKSASLGELLGAGIPVPPGFALSTAAFHQFLTQAGLAPEISSLLSSLAVDNLDAVGSACARIAQLIGSEEVSAALVAEIVRGLAELERVTGDSDAPVAVRSSAVGEDSHTATFAGQQETFLWVRGAQGVVGAVRDCWASLYSPTAVSYRARLGDAAQEPAMGVTIQLMVDAVVSGVMFTCNPVSGDPSVVAVNASWGLGEAVVAGEVTPDEYRVSKVTGEVLRQRIGEKHVEHVPAPAGGGTVRQDVPAERQEVPCLSEDDLRALLELARRVEGHFGGHQDIEWAIARSGPPAERSGAPAQRLFILQSRPVTAVPKNQSKPKPASAISLVMSTFGADRARSDS